MSKQIQPLRKVASIVVHDRGNDSDIWGQHYHYWLNRRYELRLECGHAVSRFSANFHGEKPTDLFPKRVRCPECAPVETKNAPRKPKSHPGDDPLASSLIRMLASIGDADDLHYAAAWWPECRAWLDEPRRARAHGAVVSELIVWHMTGQPGEPKVDRFSDALKAWMAEPAPDTADAARKAARSLYRDQHRVQVGWLNVRGIVCLGKAVTNARLAADGVEESLTWTEEQRAAAYSNMAKARMRLDAADRTGMLALAAGVDAPEAAKAASMSKAELDEGWLRIVALRDDDYRLPADMAPVVRRLMEAYAAALSD
jgi:hypothetical protein